MKIAVIGAGNVGSLTAMRLAQEGAGEILLVDIVKGLAEGKASDIQDARQVLRADYDIKGTADIDDIAGCGIAVLTAGLARKPGMTREELLNKNASIVKDASLNIRRLAPDAIVIVVTNPLDLMTRLALEVTGFSRERVFGMGLSLDASRFANIISGELNIPLSDIDPCVIGSHGEGMMPLARFTMVKGVSLDEIIDDKKTSELIKRTVERGHEIVTLLGSGSAYFAPSAAIAAMVKAVLKDEKRIIGSCVWLKGEYGIKGTCLGVPSRVGRNGIEDIIELGLEPLQKQELLKVSARLKEQYKGIAVT
ncbi:MAG: malate dehydrogenase [Candidatus Omnitrophota bacterium]